MPIANVRGVNLNYQVLGDHGPWVALSPGGRRDMSGIELLAGEVANQGYRVVIFDRRNCGASDVVIAGDDSEYEIWADDVKCSHGCTSGQLDEEALFYLRTRGISKDTAQAMMLYAFAGEVIGNVKNPVLKEYLDSVISERLHKNF